MLTLSIIIPQLFKKEIVRNVCFCEDFDLLKSLSIQLFLKTQKLLIVLICNQLSVRC